MRGERRVPYQLEVVDSDGIATIHGATVEVLSETGVVYEDPDAIELLLAAGVVSDDDGRVRIPEALLDQVVDSAPSAIYMYSREGEEIMRLEGGYTYCGTGSDCPYVIDSRTGERRPAVKKDIETFARLSDALPNIDFILSMGIASDVPPQTADLHHFQAMVYNTTKPIFFTAVDHQNLVDIVDLANEIREGAQALGE